MTVFNDTDKVIVYDGVHNRAEYLTVVANTIIIDNTLLEKDQEHRYRFTMGHEIAHSILHRGYFGYNPAQLSLFEVDREPMVQCRKESIAGAGCKKTLNDDRSWMEYQANALSAAIQMPKSAVLAYSREYRDDERYFAMNPIQQTYCEVSALANTFNVSFDAAQYRMKGLQLISPNEHLEGKFCSMIM